VIESLRKQLRKALHIEKIKQQPSKKNNSLSWQLKHGSRVVKRKAPKEFPLTCFKLSIIESNCRIEYHHQSQVVEN